MTITTRISLHKVIRHFLITAYQSTYKTNTATKLQLNITNTIYYQPKHKQRNFSTISNSIQSYPYKIRGRVGDWLMRRKRTFSSPRPPKNSKTTIKSPVFDQIFTTSPFMGRYCVPKDHLRITMVQMISRLIVSRFWLGLSLWYGS